MLPGLMEKLWSNWGPGQTWGTSYQSLGGNCIVADRIGQFGEAFDDNCVFFYRNICTASNRSSDLTFIPSICRFQISVWH
mmetsp:Transcript_5538/g.10867  ORF Transcript_5538/g.10867 Transcript_5538/m.10867 type:complete len:80 (-) Transcript_5538:1925-2164(-)